MRIGPKYKIARRLGEAIFPKTQRPRFAMVEAKKRANILKKRKHRSNLTEYGIQFLEKQKVRYTYGLGERQMLNYISRARRSRRSKPADELFKMLEGRLDNVIFRLGLAGSRQAARQLTNHGHVMVGGRRESTPSYQVRLGDKISPMPPSRSKVFLRDKSRELKDFKAPSWIKFNPETLEAEIIALPVPGEYETNLNFTLVTQFYSRV